MFKILGHDQHECQDFEDMYMWNKKCASVVSQMPSSARWTTRCSIHTQKKDHKK